MLIVPITVVDILAYIWMYIIDTHTNLVITFKRFLQVFFEIFNMALNILLQYNGVMVKSTESGIRSDCLSLNTSSALSNLVALGKVLNFFALVFSVKWGQ